MTVERWDESGRVWEEDHGLLDDEQVARCEHADVVETLHFPVPTRMISNGEYMPAPQTDRQKRVETRIEELADEASKKLGISRRQFLGGSGGMAAALRLDLPAVAVYQTDVAGFAKSYGLGLAARAAWGWTRRIHEGAVRTLAPSSAAADGPKQTSTTVPSAMVSIAAAASSFAPPASAKKSSGTPRASTHALTPCPAWFSAAARAFAGPSGGSKAMLSPSIR